MTLHPQLRTPHDEQRKFVDSTAKRIIIRAGRRGGKTVGAAIKSVKAFSAGHRVLYATPTSEQIDKFWHEVKRALQSDIDSGALYKNETEHVIEVPNTEQRIRAKTAWNSDTLRGDYADLLILDEWQLMNEDAWELVGAPMLLDNNGDAVFIYTPPSIRSLSVSKARDKQHAAKLFKRAQQDTTGRWATFHFSSHANPFINVDALNEITQDMSGLAFDQEIMALDKDSVPGALWSTEFIESLRVTMIPELVRVCIAVDPSVTSSAGSDEAGIIAAGIDANQHGYLLEDASLRGTPQEWAQAAVTLYNKWHADVMVAEVNQGGEMVALTISTIKGAPQVKKIHAKKGKVARAEPVQALYAPIDRFGNVQVGRVHHVGYFPQLEGEMISYLAGRPSPNRLDALVYAFTELMLGGASYQDWMERMNQESIVEVSTIEVALQGVEISTRALRQGNGRR